ncbi:diacylglycerol/lipid kinase family protein [Sphingomonas sp. ac-8]|uniref:diacylglycerol/lipid kinase family protein n=1 Tax=Sphingomonas sp. ac-8 TaxID=3242977 RepID=UPI003A809D8F
MKKITSGAAEQMASDPQIDPTSSPHQPAVRAGYPRTGIISNSRSHRNRTRGTESVTAPADTADLFYRGPRTLPALAQTLREFRDAGIELLVVDGGDGTVRDVLTCAHGIFAGKLPRIAVVPSGKTNALALDLGLPADWSVQDALEASVHGRTAARSPVEILRGDAVQPELCGFLFGAGAFVRATELAQRTHTAGAFNSFAVGLSLFWGIAQTLFGGHANDWRAGAPMRLQLDDATPAERNFYILFSSTLERLPLKLKPFGPVRAGLKVLAVDAPPKHLARAVPALLRGSQAAWLETAGYRRHDVGAFTLTLDGGFILDGELYEGGTLTVRQGTPLQFVTP